MCTCTHTNTQEHTPATGGPIVNRPIEYPTAPQVSRVQLFVPTTTLTVNGNDSTISRRCQFSKSTHCHKIRAARPITLLLRRIYHDGIICFFSADILPVFLFASVGPNCRHFPHPTTIQTAILESTASFTYVYIYTLIHTYVSIILLLRTLTD